MNQIKTWCHRRALAALAWLVGAVGAAGRSNGGGGK
jgi:hypothetical protein